MLKSFKEILHAVGRRFDSTVERCVALEACRVEADGHDWPFEMALGRPSSDELARDMAAVSDYIKELRNWGSAVGFDIVWSKRRVGSILDIPTHVVVGDIDLSARMLGRTADKKLGMMRRRAGQVSAAFPDLSVDDVARVLRTTKNWEDVDFGLLVDAGQWFAAHDARGLTPRQVPLAGFNAKWLNAKKRRDLVAMLAGKEALGLVEPPPSVLFSYLDRQYLEGGGRRFDVHVAGDAWTLPYCPETVVIVENKDSYRYFPSVSRGVCVFGSGWSGVTQVQELPWLGDASHVVYWGDMDADGLEILNGYRERGLEVASILMDLPSYRKYERFGTSIATGKRALESRERKELPYLTQDERALYDVLTDPGYKGYRRLEQERIPLDVAKEALTRAISAGE